MRESITKPRTTLWTGVVVLFGVAATLARLEWAILWVPGLLLMWHGLIAGEVDEIAVPNRTRSDLN